MLPLTAVERDQLARFVRQVRLAFESDIVQRGEVNSFGFRLRCQRDQPLRIEADAGEHRDLVDLAGCLRVLLLEADGLRFTEIWDLIEPRLTLPFSRQFMQTLRDDWTTTQRDAGLISFTVNGIPLTPYTAFRMWYYGRAAHSDRRWVKKYERVVSSPSGAAVLRLKVHEYLQAIMVPADSLAMFADYILKTEREPRVVFTMDEQGRVWSRSLEDGTQTLTPNFPYEQYDLTDPVFTT